MTRVFCALSVLAVAGCAGSEAVPGGLMEGQGELQGVKGLERLERSGPFESGVQERFKVYVDTAIVSRVDWSASAGALSASGAVAKWTLPSVSNAMLSVKVTRRDGTEGVVSWSFAIAPTVSTDRPMTAQAALLAAPMPVLDGGSLEISGGACEVRYEGTTTNVALAFTTETHPALMYGRWNGTAWSLEIVDAMGFNTGGSVSRFVSMEVEASGTPHLAYVRDGQVFYATKAAGAWTRERVDAPGQELGRFLSSTLQETTSPSIALTATGPAIVYLTGSGSSAFPYRPIVALRTGPGTWTRTVLNSAGTSCPLCSVYPNGELAVDPGGRLLVAVSDESFSPTQSRLLGLTGAVQTGFPLPANVNNRLDSVLVGANRLLVRSPNGLFDVALNASLPASTATNSSVELNGSFAGDVAWNAVTSRPVLLHWHGGVLELVTPSAAGFWTYTQLGSSSGISASLAVHPVTGEVSICYQANSRIMFQ